MSDCLLDEADAPTSVAERNARAAQDASWPFMCVAIMFTKEALQALRKGILNDKISKRMSVFSVLNEFHRACFAEFERYKKKCVRIGCLLSIVSYFWIKYILPTFTSPNLT